MPAAIDKKAVRAVRADCLFRDGDAGARCWVQSRQHPKESARTNLPLRGSRVIEFKGIGPGPLAGQLLVGMGAEATVIARPQKGPVVARLGAAIRHDPQRDSIDKATEP